MIYMNPTETFKKRIIILDDDEDLLFHTQYRLIKKGFVAAGFNEPESMYSFLHNYQPDLILIDVNLMYKDGRAICKRLRKELKFEKLLVLFSGYDYSDHDFSDWGANGFILKTSDNLELVANLSKFFQ